MNFNILVLFLSVVLIIIISSSPSFVSGSSDVIVKNLKLFVDEKEYFIKAMCYSPAPLGQLNNAKGGLCSLKTTPWGSIESNCFDSDYFDGGADTPTRNPAGPAGGGWFQPLWQRDFPIMKDLGVNTVRLYGANPTTRKASVEYPSVIPLPLGKDHTPFLNMAQQNGIKVIFPLISDYGMMTSYSTADFQRLLRWQIEEVGNHSALLMYTLGNELPLEGNPTLINLVNSYIDYARAYQVSYWNRQVPITTAVADLPSSYDNLADQLHVDIFTTNVYRGTTMTDLWSGNTVTQGWKKLSCKTNKPVFLGEIGYMSLNSAVNSLIPGWFNSLWKDMIDNTDNGCIGGAFFEYQDEGWKSDPLQQTMGVVSITPTVADGKSSTSPNVWLADTVSPKAGIFDSIKSGTYNGSPYNMNSDVFGLLGRSQYTLQNPGPAICPVSSTATSSVGSSTSTSTTTSTSTVSATTSTSTSTSSVSSTSASPATPSPTKAPSSATSSSTSSSSRAGTTSSSSVSPATTSSLKATTSSSAASSASSASTTSPTKASSTSAASTLKSTTSTATSSTLKGTTTASSSTTAASTKKGTTSSLSSSTSAASSTTSTSVKGTTTVAYSSTSSQKSSTAGATSSSTSSIISSTSPASSSSASAASPGTLGVAFSGPTPSVCTGQCGAASCCPTPAPTCYDSSIYSCLATSSSYMLCGASNHNGQKYMDGYCPSSGGCFDSFCYACVGSGLVPTGKC